MLGRGGRVFFLSASLLTATSMADSSPKKDYNVQIRSDSTLGIPHLNKLFVLIAL